MPYKNSSIAAPGKDNANLDILRSLAVLIVAISHVLICGMHVDNVGYVNLRAFARWGVLMFFVHTCLVLLYSLERRSDFWPFLVRRVFRIYPLSVAMVLLVVVFRIPAGYATNHFFVVSRSAGNILLNLTLLQNFRGGESVLTPLWSLPYEMQMYLLLPGLFVLLSLKARNIEYMLWLFGLFLALHSWRAEIHGLPSLIFLPCFLSGAVAYRGIRKWKAPSWLWMPTLAAITLLFSLRSKMLMGWFCCLLLGIMIPRFREVSWGPIRRVAFSIAKYSYSIYLIHFLCIWLAFDRLQFLSGWLRWTIFFSSFCISVFVAYQVLEAPMIRMGSKLAARLHRDKIDKQIMVGLKTDSLAP